MQKASKALALSALLHGRCNHCTYSSENGLLLALRAEVHRRLELLNQLTEDELPVYLITHLVDKYEDWQDTLKGIKKFYVTQEREAVFHDTEKWIDNEYCTQGAEYEFKIAHLTRTYAEVLSTPCLEEKKSGVLEEGPGLGREPNLVPVMVAWPVAAVLRLVMIWI